MNIIEEYVEMVRENEQDIFQVLTKVPEPFLELSKKIVFPPNLWLGVSVETPDYYWRIKILQQIPVYIRFLSLEPLLADMPDIPLEGISQVIVGGEHADNFRPMQADWVCNIRNQTKGRDIAFHFKQWAGKSPKKLPLLDGKKD
ncbi:DUF5131 family protein [Candidatus Margulisiibacteriota bacterium]